MLKVVEKRDEREAGEELLLLDEIARQSARRMLIEALKAEVDDYVERHQTIQVYRCTFIRIHTHTSVPHHLPVHYLPVPHLHSVPSNTENPGLTELLYAENRY
jgi:hypothetical protein